MRNSCGPLDSSTCQPGGSSDIQYLHIIPISGESPVASSLVWLQQHGEGSVRWIDVRLAVEVDGGDAEPMSAVEGGSLFRVLLFLTVSGLDALRHREQAFCSSTPPHFDHNLFLIPGIGHIDDLIGPHEKRIDRRFSASSRIT